MGAAMTPRRSAGETSAETDQAHWGRQPPIGVGNLPTPMHRFLPRCAERPGRSLPQCSVSYPNTPDSGAPPLRPPTPMLRFLPQCTGRPADRVGAQVRPRPAGPQDLWKPLRIEWGRRFARDSMPRCAERPGRSLPRDPPPTINATRTGPLLHGFPPHAGRIDEDRGRKGLGEHSGSGEDAHLARSAARGAPSARVDDVVGEQPVYEAAAGARRATRRSTLHPTRHSTPCATRSALRPKFRFTRCFTRSAIRLAIRSTRPLGVSPSTRYASPILPTGGAVSPTGTVSPFLRTPRSSPWVEPPHWTRPRRRAEPPQVVARCGQGREPFAWELDDGGDRRRRAVGVTQTHPPGCPIRACRVGGDGGSADGDEDAARAHVHR